MSESLTHKDPFDMNDKEREALLKKLKKENATCLEFALCGFIRIYEEGEKCECQSCVSARKIPAYGTYYEFKKNMPSNSSVEGVEK